MRVASAAAALVVAALATPAARPVHVGLTLLVGATFAGVVVADDDNAAVGSVVGAAVVDDAIDDVFVVLTDADALNDLTGGVRRSSACAAAL